MMIVLSILGVVLLALLVLLEAVSPARSTTSLYELRRLRAAKDSRAAEALKRERLLVQIAALKTPLRGVLIIVLVATLVHLLGWSKGIAAVLLVVLLYGRIARSSKVRTVANKLFAPQESRLFALMTKREKLVRIVIGATPLSQPTLPLGSREELAHVLDVSPIFSSDDKKLLESALGFGDLTVSDVMTKKEDIVTVQSGDLLGPLVLDDLHKTKHEIFPVEKNGEIVGLLDIRDHVALKRKESVYVRDVMHSGVVRINASEPLDEALEVFVDAKQPYLIAVDDDRQTVGLVGLGDTISKLTGRKRR